MNRSDWQQMPLKTRLFARALKVAEKGIESVTDLPAHRAKRAKLQQSGLGRWLFGTPVEGVTVAEIEVAGRRTLTYRPAGLTGPLPVVLNFHGGGWVQGNPEQSGWLASRVAQSAGVLVVSPTYRLAPEDQYPAAVEDAWQTVEWIVANAETLGADASRIVVMGDSAGGNLAAVMAQHSREQGGPKICGQVLIYPAVEMYDKYPSEIRLADAPLLTSANMRAFVRLYLGDQYGVEDVAASPIRANSFADLPPAFILTAQLDPLLDNGVKYRDALMEGGTPVKYHEYRGTIHGFISLPGVVPAANEALGDISRFVESVVGR